MNENITQKTVGIIGGGQLGKMLILEGRKMGIRFIVLDPQPDAPACVLADEVIVADFYNTEKIEELARKSHVVTYEFEHINSSILQQLVQKGYVVYPSPSTLSMIQDKLLQKQFLKEHHIPVPDFLPTENLQALKGMGEKIGYPFLLKTRKGGYDGKGNYFVADALAVESAYQAMGGGKHPLMVEKWIPFEKEISAIAARSHTGEIKVFPLAENTHKDNILQKTQVPAQLTQAAEVAAMKVAFETMAILEGPGLFCIEMFVLENGQALVNEIAPRTHNSGHFTIEGCMTSQFQQQLRSILGLPLGSTALLQPCVMVNLLGEPHYYGGGRLEGVEEALKLEGVSLHYYGKTETRPQRKMGHVNIMDSTLEGALNKAATVAQMVKVVGEKKEEEK